ncbi:hypothetical protein RBSH_03809 [Rhodopirellula baltica SH28]|uniref:Uncharacterized protein n=1 Tax=Rhodopirellula baltica SH28 TaxID=993517 RepID=K5D2T7_RHOBT|nr:hypothetical protein RBSH_03809 [Rhodopirellula baltica SH28]
MWVTCQLKFDAGEADPEITNIISIASRRTIHPWFDGGKTPKFTREVKFRFGSRLKAALSP